MKNSANWRPPFSCCLFITLQNVLLTRGSRLTVCLKWSCLSAARAPSLAALEFGVSAHFSLTLLPTRRLPGLLISHSSRRGQRANASWEEEQQEGELPRQVKGSRKDILLICC